MFIVNYHTFFTRVNNTFTFILLYFIFFFLFFFFTAGRQQLGKTVPGVFQSTNIILNLCFSCRTVLTFWIKQTPLQHPQTENANRWFFIVVLNNKLPIIGYHYWLFARLWIPLIVPLFTSALPPSAWYVSPQAVVWLGRALIYQDMLDLSPTISLFTSAVVLFFQSPDRLLYSAVLITTPAEIPWPRSCVFIPVEVWRCMQYWK